MAAGQLWASGALDHVAPALGEVCGIYKAFSRLGVGFFCGCRHQPSLLDAVLKVEIQSGNAVVLPAWTGDVSRATHEMGAEMLGVGAWGTVDFKAGICGFPSLGDFSIVDYTPHCSMCTSFLLIPSNHPLCHLQKPLTGTLFPGLLCKSQPLSSFSVYWETAPEVIQRAWLNDAHMDFKLPVVSGMPIMQAMPSGLRCAGAAGGSGVPAAR